MRIPGLKRFRQTAWRIRGTLFGHGAILGYHRVAEDDGDPWGNCVSPEAFAEHMEVLQREFVPVRLADLSSSRDHSYREGRRPPVVVTFDDGYAEVHHQALPILERYDIPATVFVVSDANGSTFWWDRLRLILETPAALPANMKLKVAGMDLRWAAEEGIQALYGILHQALRGLPMAALEETLDAVQAWAGGQRGTAEQSSHRTLDEEEIVELAAHPLVELGSHGATHRALSGLSRQSLVEEIGGSQLRLESLISRPVRSFSYPFGLLDDSVQCEVARNGYQRACSSRNGLISPKVDPLQLPRVWPPNANGEDMRRWLHGWTGR